MPVERREQVTRVETVRVNGQPEELAGFGRRRQLSLGDTSRMNREVHVRICERLGVKFPGATRHRHCSLGDFDRPLDQGGFLQVPICLTLGQGELARQTLYCRGQRDMTLKQAVSGVQLPSLVRLGGPSHLS
jgi:hypothetical protein